MLVEENELIVLLGLLFAGTLLLFIDHFQNETISVLKAVFFVASFSITATVNMFFSSVSGTELTQISIVYPDIQRAVSILTFLQESVPIIFFFYVLYSTLNSIQSIKKFTFDENQKRQLSFMQSSIICYLLLVPLGDLILTIFELNDKNLLFIFGVISPDLFLLMGTILLWYAYVHTSRTAFLQAQQLNSLLVITKTGLPLFSYEFHQLGDTEADTTLFSGGLTAIKSLLKEAVGTTSEIKAIKFENKAIMVSIDDGIGVFLIADRISSFLQQSLDRFTERFTEQFNVDIDNLKFVDQSAYQDADKLVERMFGLRETVL